MSYSELTKKSIKELNTLLEELRAELFSLKFKNTTRELDQTHKISLVKKDIARTLTAINMKKQEAKKGDK
ncbi:50S ribosomal protein L29 [[Mycoplasma] anseris]|uniref:Large ribosomal subunit protein uL29 n=1 Tax=[Mycoplasma] anseris TaxID=92400 RepID=A0A2Z4NCS0_9BACT|nr:50S ribosomal protein L29 [[Mycoplasma] anseris]AWX69275.1 50S ribosomal protein L29 [[Mycoplasma] anseris]